MPLYTVLAPAPPAPSAEPDPLGYVFVKDGFCWPALFFAVIWLIFRRQWLVLLLYLIAILAIAIVGRGYGGTLPLLLLGFVHVFFTLEANSLRRWTLRRHGYALIGVAEGRRVGEAEMRFFHEQGLGARPDPRQPPSDRLSAAMGVTTRRPSIESGEVVGLFPAPRGNP
jgi:hypothetical protein